MRWLLFPAASLLAVSAVRGDELPKLRSGAAAAYEGTVTIKQSSGDDGAESKYNASAVCRVREVAPGKSRLVAVRLLKSSEGEEEPLAAFDDVAVTASEWGFTPAPAGELPPDMEGNAMRLLVIFPLDLLPAFNAPAVGTEEKAEAEVSVIGLAKVRAPLVTSLKRDGDRVELTRKLAPGAQPPFEFRGDKARLLAWTETYVLDAASGLPVRVERTAAMESQAGEAKLRFERSAVLEAKKSETAPAKEASKLDALDAIEKELRGLNADFAGLQSPDGIAKRVAAFHGLARGSIFEPAVEAVDLRLASYQASGLGKIAPDFTLESLEGKQVSFREATRGKVVLLSFWGVG